MKHALLLIACALAGCAGPGGSELRLDAAVPAYGPLAGGSVVVLAGASFTPSTRVLFDGREAPLVRMLDPATGAITNLPLPVERYDAMEVFE